LVKFATKERLPSLSSVRYRQTPVYTHRLDNPYMAVRCASYIHSIELAILTNQGTCYFFVIPTVGPLRIYRFFHRLSQADDYFCKRQLTYSGAVSAS